MSQFNELSGSSSKMGDGLLTVKDVQARYGFVDPRAARSIMWQAGGFDRSNRIFVRASDLDQWERHQSKMQNLVRGVYGLPGKKTERKTNNAIASPGYQRGAWRKPK